MSNDTSRPFRAKQKTIVVMCVGLYDVPCVTSVRKATTCVKQVSQKKKKRKTKGDQVIRVEHGKRALISQPSDQEKSLLHPFGYRHTSSMGGGGKKKKKAEKQTAGPCRSEHVGSAAGRGPYFPSALFGPPPIADERLFPI
jgi:L,D-peptidoglycan transpeptidase YkuD (ErfK/YbiS/YcfS/YnhG family)